jgi:hypothetical protein
VGELVNRNNFTSSLPICMPFISFSYLIPLAKIFSATLNKSSESEHPYLLPDLRGNALSFPYSV